jgi:hypothetical protein
VETGNKRGGVEKQNEQRISAWITPGKASKTSAERSSQESNGFGKQIGAELKAGRSGALTSEWWRELSLGASERPSARFRLRQERGWVKGFRTIARERREA